MADGGGLVAKDGGSNDTARVGVDDAATVALAVENGHVLCCCFAGYVYDGAVMTISVLDDNVV